MFKKTTLFLITATSFCTQKTFAKPARTVFAVYPSVSNTYIPTSTIEQSIRAITLQGVNWQNSKILGSSDYDVLQISADIDSDYINTNTVSAAIKALAHIFDVSVLFIEPTTITGKIRAKALKFATEHPNITSLPMVPLAGIALWNASSTTAYKMITSGLLAGASWVLMGNFIYNTTHNRPEMPILVK